MIAQLVAEVFQMLFVQASFEIGAGVHTGRSVSLEVDEVASDVAGRWILIRAAEEMVVADLDQGRERRVSGQMATDIRIVFIGAHDHSERVPPRQAFDAPFDLTVARIRHLVFRRNGIDVRSVPAQRDSHAEIGGAFHQVFEQVTRSVWTYLIDNIIEGFNPFGGFLGVEVVWCFYSWFQHGVHLKVAFLGATGQAGGSPSGSTKLMGLITFMQP